MPEKLINYSPEQENPKVFETNQPETRVYKPTEEYSFLVHVAIHDVRARFDEIGLERGDDVLMTTLLTDERQGTFCGEGGFIIEPPKADAIKGMSRVDSGGKIANGRMDSLAEMCEPTSNMEYNQVDMGFDAGKVTGVMLKVTTEGVELGNAGRNKQLKEIAAENNLPIATIEVKPSPMPTEVSSAVKEFPDGAYIKSYDIPNGDDHFLRVEIAHGEFYHAPPGVDTISRSMVIDQFGQMWQQLTPEQELRIKNILGSRKDKDEISEKEFAAITDGLDEQRLGR